MPDPLAEARYELALANRIIAHEGVLDGFGHVSMRHPTDRGRYLLARSRSPELIEPSDILEFTLDSEPVSPPAVALYGERVIHGCIYQARPDVNAVCHHHSHAVLPFCITGIELVPVFHMGAVLGTAAPFWDSRDDFGDTNMLVVKPEEGRSLAKALGSHWMVLMRRHGATLVGTALRELVFRTIYSHANAEIQLRSMAGPDRPVEPRRGRAHGSVSAAAPAHGAGLGILDRTAQEERRDAKHAPKRSTAPNGESACCVFARAQGIAQEQRAEPRPQASALNGGRYSHGCRPVPRARQGAMSRVAPASASRARS
jgi:ribulose-5-phosphate 4-epimerase/fuculose-1-phosphate aldolase